jgi:hypothetical protein
VKQIEHKKELGEGGEKRRKGNKEEGKRSRKDVGGRISRRES